MASVIKAGNATDGVQVTSDNTGILELKTGTGSGTTAVTVDTSQNVGIGTTGNLNYSSRLKVLAPSNGSVAEFYTPGNTYKSRINLTNDFSGAGIGSDSGALVFYANDATTERMRLDSSGNLGLGVTPSAWDSTYKVFQANTYFAAFGATTVGAVQSFMSSNAYYSGGSWKGGLTGSLAALYQQLGGAHQWLTSGSAVTANTNFTFTQAMTLDASGNLMVGTTTTSSIAASGRGLIEVNGSSDSAFAMKAGGTLYGYLFASAGEFRIANITANPLTFFTNNTERARIDASGFTQFSSNLVMPYQGAPTSKAAAATLTGAELITGILNTTGTTYTITLPTGTNIEGALTWSANNVCLDWYVINTASGTITIGANGNTTLGSLTIATGTSAQFRIRRTAANTFTVYRL